MRWGCFVSYRYIGSDTGFDFVKLVVVAVTLRENDRVRESARGGERETARARSKKRVRESAIVGRNDDSEMSLLASLGSWSLLLSDEMSNPSPNPKPSQAKSKFKSNFKLIRFLHFTLHFSQNRTRMPEYFVYLVSSMYNTSYLLTTFTRSMILSQTFEIHKKEQANRRNYLTRPSPRHKTKRKH